MDGRILNWKVPIVALCTADAAVAATEESVKCTLHTHICTIISVINRLVLPVKLVTA